MITDLNLYTQPSSLKNMCDLVSAAIKEIDHSAKPAELIDAADTDIAFSVNTAGVAHGIPDLVVKTTIRLTSPRRIKVMFAVEHWPNGVEQLAADPAFIACNSFTSADDFKNKLSFKYNDASKIACDQDSYVWNELTNALGACDLVKSDRDLYKQTIADLSATLHSFVSYYIDKLKYYLALHMRVYKKYIEDQIASN